MKIKRVIDGKEIEIELTDQELRDAYFIQQRNYDREDVMQCIGGNFTEEDPNCMIVDYFRRDLTVADLKKLLADDDFIDRAACLSRKFQDNNDCISECLWDCVDEAICEYIDDYDFEKENKEE